MPPPKNWQINFLLQDNKNNSFCKQEEDRHLAYEIYYGVVCERQQSHPLQKNTRVNYSLL